MADRHGPQLAGRFKVEIDGVEVPGWQRVDLPSSHTERGEYREGDDPDWEQQLWGQTTFSPLSMVRGVQPGDTQVFDWRETIRMGDVDEGRKTVEVTLMDEEGEDQIRWKFENAWITDYDPPTLDAAADGEILTERIVLDFESESREEL